MTNHDRPSPKQACRIGKSLRGREGYTLRRNESHGITPPAAKGTVAKASMPRRIAAGSQGYCSECTLGLTNLNLVQARHFPLAASAYLQDALPHHAPEVIPMALGFLIMGVGPIVLGLIFREEIV